MEEEEAHRLYQLFQKTNEGAKHKQVRCADGNEAPTFCGDPQQRKPSTGVGGPSGVSQGVSSGTWMH